MDEEEILEKLSTLCTSTGYIHAIAYLCVISNFVLYKDELTGKDLYNIYNKKNLIRTELSTLIGLMVQKEIDFNKPSLDLLKTYIENTYVFMEELHKTVSNFYFQSFIEACETKDLNQLIKGYNLREAFFYSSESAYSFQYRDFSIYKYQNDEAWLTSNKGFSIQSAHKVVIAIENIIQSNINSVLYNLNPIMDLYESINILDIFTFSKDEIINETKLSNSEINSILSAFTLQNNEKNECFKNICDFNISNAMPLIRANNDKYILLQKYSLCESLYESPVFWMNDNKSYRDTALKHRWQFVECFCYDKLYSVFGKNHVYKNVNIIKNKNIVGEIDVLVIFGDQIIIVQSKSKRLTIEAKKGNDVFIQDDFKKSIQNSYNQGLSCAQYIRDSKYDFIICDSKELNMPMHIKYIYIYILHNI